MLKHLIAHRRALHRIPELDDQLPKTQAYLLSQLEGLRCRMITPGRSAVLAYFDVGKPDTAAFRSDMDALPIEEQTGLSFCSEHPGRMHACGHDGHMAMLLCLAQWINGHLDQLSRNVLLVFQPAEETTGGARDICQTVPTYRMAEAYPLKDRGRRPFRQLGEVETRKGSFGLCR